LPHIFLSYNREDRTAAEHFAQALEALGHEVWWDAGLRVGEAYDEVTEAALRGASAVVVLWSPRSVASRWVRAEATLAQRLGTLFPVMIEPCERPVMFELTQTADLIRWNGRSDDPAWTAFAADLSAFIAARPPPTDAPPIATGARPRGFAMRVGRRRFLMQAGGLVGVAAAAGAGAWIWNTTRPGGRSSDRTLAVLPFRNISGSADQDYFSEGLSAELRAALTRNPGLQVAAPTSSREVARDAADPVAVGRKLGVAFVLQGTVARAGGVIRVAADLIDAQASLTRWSETFERSISDVFAVQSEIAAMVAEALAVQITAPGSTAATAPDGPAGTPGGSTNVAAYEDFLHGREAFNLAASAETDRRALAWFDAAIAKDPRYAAAHVWRARTLSVLAAQSGDAGAMRRDRDAAIAAARAATTLAPTYAAAHTTLGWVLFNQALDVRAARVAFDSARALGGGDADVLMSYAVFSARTGRVDEARRDIARALVLDPLNPSAFRFAGAISIIASDNERALGELDRALALNPTGGVIHAYRGAALAALGQWPEARAAYAAEPNATFGLPGLAICDWKLGRKDAARQAFERLRTTIGDAALYQQALVLAQWGETGPALDALEKGYAAFDAGLAMMYTDGFLLGLRNQPRFQALLRTIGFV